MAANFCVFRKRKISDTYETLVANRFRMQIFVRIPLPISSTIFIALSMKEWFWDKISSKGRTFFSWISISEYRTSVNYYWPFFIRFIPKRFITMAKLSLTLTVSVSMREGWLDFIASFLFEFELLASFTVFQRVREGWWIE